LGFVLSLAEAGCIIFQYLFVFGSCLNPRAG
jgi:hypothetical protein